MNRTAPDRQVIIGIAALIAAVLLCASSAVSQELDSAAVATSPVSPDTLLAIDSLAIAASDSTIRFETINSADTIVTYTAKDSVVYDLDSKQMLMYSSAKVDYGQYQIAAAQLTINWDANTMHAQSAPDSLAVPGDTASGYVVFSESGKQYRGREMTYNFKTKQGVIDEGKTTIDDGYYTGEIIKRKSENTYFISGGEYSTCDQEVGHKHFHFGSPKMKVVPNDVIVAEPITFYIEEIPLLWIPFAIIPSSGGRSSGVIIPSFGEDYYRGRYLTKGGYYLAASDYWDLTLTGDWYWKGGYLLRSNVRYALRYNFSGNIEASYGRQMFDIGNPYKPDDEPRTDYSIAVHHNQSIDPNTQLNVDFSFISQGFYNKYSTDINQLVSQTADSRATFSTRWEGTNRSLTIAVARTQNIQTNTSNTSLPDISFNQSQIFPFRAKNSIGEKWYEQIGFNYRARALNKVDVNLIREGTEEQLRTFTRHGINHDLSFILNPKIGYLTLSPSFNYQERWYIHRLERYADAADSTVRARDVRGFYPIRTFNAGISMSTKLYGILRPNIWGIQGIRHTIQPSIGYSYNPDFSKDQWGYYRSYTGFDTNVVRYDPYTGFDNKPGEVFGGVSSGESQSITMNLSNVFEMKLDPAQDDTTGEAKRVKLLNLNAGTAYNFAADSLKLSAVSVSFSTAIGQLLDISGSASFDPYVYQRRTPVYDTEGNISSYLPGRRINTYMADAGEGLARLTSFGVNLRTAVGSETFASAQGAADTTASQSMLSPQELDAYNFRIKWQLSMGYSYSMSQSDPDYKSRNSNLDASLSLDLTPKWKITASTYYDIVRKEIGTPRINISRDLHCWEMNFSWVPAGPYRQYNFVIRIKAPQLQDIKFERKGSDRGVY